MRKLRHPVIVGLDEAGRGPLAGPVVAGACVSHPSLKENPFVRDSKQLSPEEREEAYAWIVRHCAYGCGIVSAEEIDRIGILAATEKAMNQALAAVAARVKPTYLIVDGQDHFWFDYPHSGVVRGDQTEACIAAASIVAKVTRDSLMVAAATDHPSYGFEQHKGYGTTEHVASLRAHGPCVLHRRSFLRSLLR